MKTLVLLSGGMDSVVALHFAAKKQEVIAAAGFHYGSKHNDCELACAKFQADSLHIPFYQIALPVIAEEFTSDLLEKGGSIPDGHYEEASMQQTVVPFRNGILLSIAAGLAESKGAEAILIAAHSGDHAIYPDCREDFLRPMAAAIRAGTYAQIELLRPFVAMSKTEIARIGHDLGVDFANTWSCYKGGKLHCGTCGTCVERREAFFLAQIPDPTNYLDSSPLPPSPSRLSPC